MPQANPAIPRRVRVAIPRPAGSFGSLLGVGVAVIYMSVIVLIPFAALLNGALENGWGSFWSAITNPQAVAALKLTVGVSVVVTLVNAVMGTGSPPPL